jgi:Raf kinase inhibitor-like YbhB/YbcL family protein
MIEALLGRLLRGVHAGDARLLWNDASVAVPQTIRLESPAFVHGAPMPARYGGHAAPSPPLRWSGVPAQAQELLLLVEDPDVPLRRPVVHGVALLAVERRRLREGEVGAGAADIRLGRGFLGRRGYSGPRPVRAHGAHRYVFQLYALDCRLSVADGFDRAAVCAAMDGHVIARGRLDGIFERS